MKSQSKTIDEHRNYLYEIVKLKLFFLHGYLSEHPEENFRDVIRQRVDIYRKTDANFGPLTPQELFFNLEPWRSMESAAWVCFERNRGDKARFELEAFEIFRPSIERRCQRDFEDKSSVGRYKDGCFRNDLNISCPDYQAVFFHIANDKVPDSIFDYPEHIKSSLFKLCDNVEALQAPNLATCTWLNGLTAFVKYFPTEWQENMQKPLENVEWHYGFWGQFISARGTFNAKYGRILRETGRLPYYPRMSWCSVKALREHLKNI